MNPLKAGVIGGLVIAGLVAFIARDEGLSFVLGVAGVSELVAFIVVTAFAASGLSLESDAASGPSFESDEPKAAPTTKYRPHCPTCGSPDVRRITGARKVARFAALGVFAVPKVLKSYECLDCQARW